MTLLNSTKKYCVVVPLYKEEITLEEELSLKQLVKTVQSADIYLIYPKGMSTEVYYQATDFYPFKTIELAAKHFSSTHEYSRLLESPMFYNKFKKYEYLMIYQTDCWIFEDKLEYFANMGYDYYGSPWIVENKNHIGNGGFCMRKVSKFIEFTTEHKGEFYPIEDRYFCEMYQDEFNLCPYEVGCEFGLCNHAWYDQLGELNKGTMKCPMGMHKMLDERIAQYFFKQLDAETANKFPEQYNKYKSFSNKVDNFKKSVMKNYDAISAILKNI